ncbi:hypothetical protein ES707_22427 [subsurface metagenome]
MYAEVYVYEQDINIDLFRTYINKQGRGLLLYFRRVHKFYGKIGNWP